MNRAHISTIQLVVAGFVALSVGVVGLAVVDQMPRYDPDEICATAHDDGWVHFETKDTDGFYCLAPNGSVHRTVVNWGGPAISLDFLPIAGGLFALVIIIGLVATLPKRWAARKAE